MVPKYLIDECLSPALALLARQRGCVESSHVTWLGKSGWKDWELKAFIVEGDWTFVTRNSVDFRGRIESPGVQGQYAGVPIHAGLVCINGPEKMTAKTEADLFGLVLDATGIAQLVNEVVEITLSEMSGEYKVHRYALPTVTT
ncbi:MAG TPA: DUF5615 family PIN-like protein [Acidobacteriaceae bacterium]|nr:DUF5615 family PIN-like protein [Acidobacteriaceae bacterium]